MVRASVDVGEGHSLALDGLGHASRFLLATSLGTLFVIATPHLSQTQVWGMRLGHGNGNETDMGMRLGMRLGHGNETGNVAKCSLSQQQHPHCIYSSLL